MCTLRFAKLDGGLEVLIPAVDAEDAYDGFDAHLSALLGLVGELYYLQGPCL
jgi:hypothetical protein